MSAAMGKEAVNSIKAAAPVLEGKLIESIRVTRGSYKYKGTKISGGSVQVRAGGKGARHATLITYGTFKMPHNPYFEEALRSSSSRMFQASIAAGAKSFTKVMGQIASDKLPSRVARLAE